MSKVISCTRARIPCFVRIMRMNNIDYIGLWKNFMIYDLYMNINKLLKLNR